MTLYQLSQNPVAKQGVPVVAVLVALGFLFWNAGIKDAAPELQLVSLLAVVAIAFVLTSVAASVFGKSRIPMWTFYIAGCLLALTTLVVAVKSAGILPL